MIPIDIRTLFLNYAAINIISFIMIYLLYLQTRIKFPESKIIVISFAMSATGNSLQLFRAILPDFLSIVIGNTLVVSSTVVLMIGFQKFVSSKGTQIQNYIFIVIFFAVHYYFTELQPNLYVRIINIAVFYILLNPQIIWLMLAKTTKEQLKNTRLIGIIFSVIFILQCIHVVFILLRSNQTQNYFNLDYSESLFLIVYQIFFLALVYSISLMYNSALFIDLKEQADAIILLSAKKHQLQLEFKNKELTQNALYLASLKEIQKNIVKEWNQNIDNEIDMANLELHKLMITLKNSSQESKIWKDFDNRFKEVNNEFHSKLTTSYPSLSLIEIRVASLLKENYTSKEIAEILQRSLKTVENIRGVIRKKLDITKSENLASFLRSIK